VDPDEGMEPNEGSDEGSDEGGETCETGCPPGSVSWSLPINVRAMAATPTGSVVVASSTSSQTTLQEVSPDGVVLEERTADNPVEAHGDLTDLYVHQSGAWIFGGYFVAEQTGVYRLRAVGPADWAQDFEAASTGPGDVAMLATGAVAVTLVDPETETTRLQSFDGSTGDAILDVELPFIGAPVAATDDRILVVETWPSAAVHALDGSGEEVFAVDVHAGEIVARYDTILVVDNEGVLRLSSEDGSVLASASVDAGSPAAARYRLAILPDGDVFESFDTVRRRDFDLVEQWSTDSYVGERIAVAPTGELYVGGVDGLHRVVP